MKYILLLIAELIFINSLHSQTLIENFNMPTPIANPEIWTINIDNNDKILISGDIDFYGEAKIANLVRLNPDGSLDESFHFNSIAKPSVVDLLSTGEIITLGGDSIYKVDDSGSIIKTINILSSFIRMTIIQDDIFLASYDSLIKLNSDLEIDVSFNRDNEFSGFITTIANQGNDKLLVAGDFNQVNGLVKNNLARFDLDGNLDLSFDAGSGTSDYIGGLVIQPDNKIILSESTIYSFNGITCDGIVRLNEDGSLDMGFTTPIYYSFDVTLQNGKILVSAYYDDGLTHEKRILRLKPDGTMDNGFNIIDADASEIALFSDGKILANTINNQNGITRYSENGILDEEFSPPLERIGGFDNAAFYGDFIIVTGNFFRLDDLETTQIGKLNLDGSLDLNFKVSDNVNTGSTSNNRPREVKVKSENEIFISLGNKLLKLDSKGNPVDGFSCIEEVEVPGHFPDSYFVEAFEFLSNDQIVVRGPNGAYLLNEDGTQDLSFIIKHNINATAISLDLQSDEKILIGGAFTEVNGQEANYLARFNKDGTFDDSFNSTLGASFSPFVDKIQVLSNDEIIVNSWIWYGSFNNLDLIKLGKDGDLDETFNNHIISAFPERTHLIEGDDHINESYLFSYSDYSECEVGKLDYSGKVDSNFGIVNKYNIVVEDKFSVKPIGSGSKHFLVLGEFILENGENTNGLLFSDNYSPVINGTVSTLSTSEENPILITLDDLIIEDPDNEFPDDFSLTVMDGENYTVSENQVVPSEDFNGSLTIPVTVNDGVDDSQPFQLTLDVTAVNDIPVITGTSTPLTTLEDTPFTISIDDLTVEDPDNEFPDDFSLTVLDGDNYSVSENRVIPAEDFNGILTILVTVNDGVDDSQAFELYLDVTAVNDIPVITGTIASLATLEDTPFTISIDNLTVEDPDNEFPDDFSLTVLDGENYSVSENQVIPAEDFNGILTILVTVNDGEDDSQAFELYLDVTAVNDIPVITGTIASLATLEDTPFTISIDNLTVEDPDNEFPDDFSLTVMDGENYSVSENQVIPAEDFNGILTILVTVNDGEDDSQAFELYLDVTAVNDIPVITGTIASLATLEDTPFEITSDLLTIDDPDNEFPDDFSLTVMDGENYTVSENQVVPAEEFNGILTIPVTANDGEDDSQSFQLTLEVTAVNDIPVITGTTTSFTTMEDTPFVINIDDLVVEDPDNDFPGDFSLTVLDGENYTVSENQVVPVQDFNGSLTIPVTVSDGVDDSQPFQLTVEVTMILGLSNITPEVIIYPNPATWQITISGLCEVNTDDVMIYNLEGVVMNQRKKIEGDQITIDLSSLIDGTYILIINSDESSIAKRIVKY